MKVCYYPTAWQKEMFTRMFDQIVNIFPERLYLNVQFVSVHAWNCGGLGKMCVNVCGSLFAAVFALNGSHLSTFQTICGNYSQMPRQHRMKSLCRKPPRSFSSSPKWLVVLPNVDVHLCECFFLRSVRFLCRTRTQNNPDVISPSRRSQIKSLLWLIYIHEWMNEWRVMGGAGGGRVLEMDTYMSYRWIEDTSSPFFTGRFTSKWTRLYIGEVRPLQEVK